MFKVVPDQLKISDGWVRCGHCSDVFDATLYLEGQVPVEPPPVARPHPHEDDEGDWLLEPGVSGSPVQGAAVADVVSETASPLPREGGDSTFAPVARTSSQPWFKASRSSEFDSLKAPSQFLDELKQFSQSTFPDQPAYEASELPGPVVDRTETWAGSRSFGTASGHAPFSDTPEPGFVRQARRMAFWQSTPTRAALVVSTVLLVGVLAVQWAVHERDRLAAQYPATVPWLASLCRPLACQLGPVRQIEAVVIDSSNLVRRLGNFYAFDLVLKNSASVPVAVPALELSLTDTRDAVVSRRVFLPEEWPGSPALLPANGSLSVSLRLSIADSGVSSMTGYRALVFYP